MQSFSDRIGITKPRDFIQIQSIDDDLKNSLWNALTIFLFDNLRFRVSENREWIEVLLKAIWIDFFKKRLDEMPQVSKGVVNIYKDFFFSAEWYQVYNFIEFVPQNIFDYEFEEIAVPFMNFCNSSLEKEMSAYRFVDSKISQITDEEEIRSVEDAISNPDTMITVTTHLKSALKFLSDRESPEYRNSIKESISAVESYCKIMTNDSKASLGLALQNLSKSVSIHKTLKDAFNKLYAYTSDEGGIRHALLDEDNVGQEDAKFMLVSCSAFINYLRQKESKLK